MEMLNVVTKDIELRGGCTFLRVEETRMQCVNIRRYCGVRLCGSVC